MKIGILFKDFDRLHKAKDTGRLAQEFALRGDNNVVVYTGKKGISDEDVIYEVKFIDVTNNVMPQWSNGEKPDVLLIYHMPLDLIHLCEYAKSKGIKIIFKLDTDGNMPVLGSDTIRPGFYYSVKKGINALINISYIEKVTILFSLADFVVIESSVAYRRFVSFFPHFAAKFKIIPNGCSFPPFQEYKKTNAVAAVGTFDHTGHKRPKRLLKAFQQAGRVYLDWKLIMIGNVRANLVREYESEENITFLGKCTYEEVGRHLEKSKILLLSSQYEGFPNIFPDALARNCTICSTPVPAARDVVNGYELGTVAEDYYCKDLGNALIAEMSLWENGCRKQKQIYEFAKPKYSMNNIADSLIRLFAIAISGAASSSSANGVNQVETRS